MKVLVSQLADSVSTTAPENANLKRIFFSCPSFASDGRVTRQRLEICHGAIDNLWCREATGVVCIARETVENVC